MDIFLIIIGAVCGFVSLVEMMIGDYPKYVAMTIILMVSIIFIVVGISAEQTIESSYIKKYEIKNLSHGNTIKQMLIIDNGENKKLIDVAEELKCYLNVDSVEVKINKIDYWWGNYSKC